MPNRSDMHRLQSIALATASSDSKVLIKTWLVPNNIVTTFSRKMLPPLGGNSGGPVPAPSDDVPPEARDKTPGT